MGHTIDYELHLVFWASKLDIRYPMLRRAMVDHRGQHEGFGSHISKWVVRVWNGIAGIGHPYDTDRKNPLHTEQADDPFDCVHFHGYNARPRGWFQPLSGWYRYAGAAPTLRPLVGADSDGVLFIRAVEQEILHQAIRRVALIAGPFSSTRTVDASAIR